MRAGRPEGDDYTDIMAFYHEYLRRRTCLSEDYCYAFSIFEDPTRREIVEALFLAEAEHKDISDAFGLSRQACEAYQELFFDTKKFRSRLDKISYIENYPDKFGKELKLRAYSLGANFIFFKYANLIPETEEQRQLVKRMFMASAYRAMEANFNPIASTISKAALEWSKNMLKAYEAMEKLMGDTGEDSRELHKYLVQRTLDDPTAVLTDPVLDEDII